MRRTRGSETSQYPEEEKSSEIPSVAASEGGRAQTDPRTKETGTGTGIGTEKKAGDYRYFFLYLYLYLYLLPVFFVLGSGL
jgi:hypothetical protein